jgi:branched-chain amino acid transport system substrate-binding protein
MTSQVKNLFVVVLGIVVIAALVWWGASREVADTAKGSIKIGVMAPLSGPAASLGQAAFRGFELAIKEANEQGGVNNRLLELIVEDTQGNPKIGINAFNKLVSADTVPVVVQLFAARVEVPLIPLVQEKQVFFLAHSFHPDLANKGKFIWRHSGTIDDEARVIKDFLQAQGIKRVGIIALNDDYGLELARQVRAVVSELGGVMTAEEKHEVNATDLRTIVTKVAGMGPEAIVVADFGTPAGLLVQQLKEYGYDGVVLLSAGFIGTPDAVTAAGEAKQGMYFLDFVLQREEQFQPLARRYSEQYGEEIPRAAGVTYGTGELLVNLLRQVGDDPLALADALSATKNFKGSVEEMTILPNGNITTQLFVNRFE